MANCKRCGDQHYWDMECSSVGLLEKEVEQLHREVIEQQKTVIMLRQALSQMGAGSSVVFRVVEEAKKLCESFQSQGRGNSLALEDAVREYNDFLAKQTQALTG